jgi:hypothetical protein
LKVVVTIHSTGFPWGFPWESLKWAGEVNLGISQGGFTLASLGFKSVCGEVTIASVVDEDLAL